MGKKLFIFFVFSVLALNAEDKLSHSFLTGKFNPAENANFEIIPDSYALQSGMYMQKDALTSFKKLSTEARKNGFHVFIISALRDFSSQKYIWESKYNGLRLIEGKNLRKTLPNKKKRALKILEYSSMPGTSRHHWGTDIDIGFDISRAGNMLTNQVYDSGEGKKFYQWMTENAQKFGFCQPYKNDPHTRNPGIKYGYQEEKWHWSFRPLSSLYLRNYIENADSFSPSGFEGSSAVKDIFLDYVTNISQDCI